MLITNKGYDFDSSLPTKYWNIKTRIEYIQRRVIIFSIMYYNMSESCITDKQFDCISKQLVEYMNTTNKKILEKTKYWYVLNDFDGTTGFDLPYRLNEKDKRYLTTIAQCISQNYNGGKSKDVKW